MIDAMTAKRINRMTAAEVTTFVRTLFNDQRVYADTYRGRRCIMRMVSAFCVEYLGCSHRVRVGHPGNWAEAILAACKKVEAEEKKTLDTPTEG